MIQFEVIRSALVQGLSTALGVKVIEMNGVGKVPALPFLTYDFPDPSGEIIGHMAQVSVGGKVILTGTTMLTVSFQSYAKDKAASINQAERARDWLMSDGHWLLKDNAGAVVVTVGAIQNRDIQIGEEWERRNGFDVELRTTNKIISTLTEIEKANLKEVEYIGVNQ